MLLLDGKLGASVEPLFGLPLHRVINGPACIERQYGLGRLRTDLLLIGAVIEAKLQRVGRTTEAHLVIFDRRPDRAWEERISRRDVQCGEREVAVRGGRSPGKPAAR